MSTQTVTDPRAWRADSVGAPSSWYYTLPDRLLAVIDQGIQELRRRPRSITSLECMSDTTADLEPALCALEEGRGFVILNGVPVERYSPQELQAAYWLVGQLLGQPMEQNVQGTLLYDVRDTGQDVRYGARFSVTNAETSFHTDNSFGETVLDYVGLLCVQTAKSGGLSQVISGCAVRERLLQESPEVGEILSQPFHVDRRGGLRPGDAPTIRFPILDWDGQELTCRYLRYWIEVGHEKARQPLTPEQIHALDVLDRVAQDPDLRAEFNLERGDMFFINNRWILHNRTGFEDYPELERRRHYVRLWLRAKPTAASA